MKIRARIFVDEPLFKDAHIEAPAHIAHYLNGVMRLKNGEYITLFNGKDGLWLAEFSSTSRRSCSLYILEQIQTQPADTPSITLNFALLKKTPTDFLIQKATELGATHFQPIITERTQSDKIKIERIKDQIIEASEQCERLDIATIAEPILLNSLLGSLNKQTPLIYGNETGQGVPISQLLTTDKSFKDIYFLIGPEGGFSPQELEILKAHNYTTSVGLGPRILRAETAAITMLTAFQLYQGDWSQMPKWSLTS
ncbi:MAG: 16S rRNA (uracil(1498)-N(3))-methyltransferase [Alphaproteobacteria bacterium]